jgi:asparagine synthetase B (glutamine-hydrolysing)
MTEAIIHRGAGGEGHWISDKGHIGFGHRRLAILDLSDKGRQPMLNAEIVIQLPITEKFIITLSCKLNLSKPVTNFNQMVTQKFY